MQGGASRGASRRQRVVTCRGNGEDRDLGAAEPGSSDGREGRAAACHLWLQRAEGKREGRREKQAWSTSRQAAVSRA
jgi:hypothetical protein